jgi:hypothetical protein
VDSAYEIAELRRTLLEIEWTSRRRANVATLDRINDLARAALVKAAASTSGTPQRTATPEAA